MKLYICPNNFYSLLLNRDSENPNNNFMVERRDPKIYFVRPNFTESKQRANKIGKKGIPLEGAIEVAISQRALFHKIHPYNKCLRREIRTVGTKNKHCLMNQHKKGEKNNIFWHIIGIIFKACRVAKIPR